MTGPNEPVDIAIVLIHPHIHSRLAVVVDVDLTMLLSAVFLEWAAALIRSSDAHPPHHAGSFDHGSRKPMSSAELLWKGCSRCGNIHPRWRVVRRPSPLHR